MNHDDILTFLTVANERNITEASKILFVSQSTVSQRIKNIETELGIKLFERYKGIRNIEITEQGKQFQVLANQYIYIMDSMEEIKNNEFSDNLNIGGIDIINSYILYNLFKDLSEKDPNEVNLSIFTHHSNELFNLMETKKIDMAFVYSRYPSKEIFSIPLFSEPMYLITSSSNSVLTHKKSYKDFDRRKNIYLKWSAQFELWFSNHWDMKISPYISVNTGNLLFSYLRDVKDSWAIAPLSVIKSFGNDNVRIVDIDISIPHQECFQLISKSLSQYKKSTYQKFQVDLNKYLLEQEDIFVYKTVLNTLAFDWYSKILYLIYVISTFLLKVKL